MKEDQRSGTLLGSALSETVRAAELQELGLDLAEFGLDRVLESDLAKELPIVRSLLAVRKAALAVRDHFLLQKTLSFLGRLGELSPEEREAAVLELETSSSQANVGAALLHHLDRLDDLNKPELVARLFAATARGKLSAEEFWQAARAIERVELRDFVQVLREYQDLHRGRDPQWPPDTADLPWETLSGSSLVRLRTRTKSASARRFWKEAGELRRPPFEDVDPLAEVEVGYVRSALGKRVFDALSDLSVKSDDS